MDDWRVGDDAIWLCEARGGYGFVQRVHAVVVAVTPKRIRIRVQRRVGNEWHEEQKTVTPQRLFRRERT